MTADLPFAEAFLDFRVALQELAWGASAQPLPAVAAHLPTLVRP